MNIDLKQLRLLFGRRMAYRRTFNTQSPDVKIVLADLSRFCCATRPTTRVSPFTKSIDPMAMAIAEGRREVWLRIQAHLNMDDRDIQKLQHLNEGESQT